MLELSPLNRGVERLGLRGFELCLRLHDIDPRSHADPVLIACELKRLFVRRDGILQ